MPDALQLVKVPLRAERLVAVARRRGLPLRNLDEGYLCHCVLRELWQDRAPAPFVLRSRGRALDIWGYTRAAAEELIEHARAYGDPSLLDVIGDPDLIAGKSMPTFETGRRIGFQLRACPVVRLGRGSTTHRPGAEVDAFLAACSAAGAAATVSREEVYRAWLTKQFNRADTTGVSAETIRVTGFTRERLVRLSQGTERHAKILDRPDVHFEGELLVANGDRFNGWLTHGVGRHRAFGFGALMLMPPAASRVV